MRFNLSGALKVTVVALIILSFSSLSFATDLTQYGVAEKREVTFFDAVKISGTVVPAGKYQVLHTMAGEDHVMVFKQLGVSKDKQVEVKAKCSLKKLDKKADQSLIGYTTQNNEKVLNMLQFKGDTAQHLFE